MIELVDTTSSAIAAEFIRARRQAGSPAMGMVMTLVFVVCEEDAPAAMDAARTASREHPARVLGVIIGDGRGASRVDAQVGIGSGWAGESAMIRLRGEVTKHPASVVLPLLLPDSPVVVWWPENAPDDPAEDPLGKLARRRITDAAAVPRNKAQAMLTQCHHYSPGNSDLAPHARAGACHCLRVAGAGAARRRPRRRSQLQRGHVRARAGPRSG